MEFLFFIFPLLLIFGTHKLLVGPFISGKIEIDRIQFPTLERAQRILRASNTKARDRELEEALRTRRQLSGKATYDEQKIHHDRLNAKVKRNHEDLQSWQFRFNASIPPKPAGDPNTQEARFVGGYFTGEDTKARWAQDEANYNAKVKAWSGVSEPDDPEDSYGVRYIDANMRVNVRTQPNTESRLWGTLLPNTTVSLAGWIYGESLSHPDPNNIWFRLNLVGSSEEVYIWSGAVYNKSTSGLPNLNQPETNDYGYDYKEYLKAWNGAVVATVASPTSRTSLSSSAPVLTSVNNTVWEFPKYLDQ